MIKISINGKSLELGASGIKVNDNNVIIRNGKIIVDNKTVGKFSSENISITVEGNVNILDCDESVTVKGNVGSVDCGGSCICGDVEKYVDAGGSVTCGDIGGDLDCGGSCTCKEVNGYIDAGGSVIVTK